MSRLQKFLSIALAFCAWLAFVSPLQAQTDEQTYEPLLPGQQIGEDGVFDPSLTVGENGRLYMSFSAVNPNSAHPFPHDRTVSTYLARSNDNGRTWNILDRPANGIDNIKSGDDLVSWHHEVSTILHDNLAGSPPWVLISHHYPKLEGERQFKYGWIALKTAGTFEELTRAAETKLFVGKAFTQGMQSPLLGDPVLALHDLHGDLAHCAVLTEPALLANENGIFLALTCVEARIFWQIHHKIILLTCDRPCNPAKRDAWRYVATLLDEADAAKSTADYYTAADLVADGNSALLIASPVSDTPFDDAYNGCDVFRFADIEEGKLAGENGEAKRLSHTEGSPGSFSGACAQTFNPDLTLLSQLSIRNGRPYFSILRKLGN